MRGVEIMLYTLIVHIHSAVNARKQAVLILLAVAMVLEKSVTRHRHPERCSYNETSTQIYSPRARLTYSQLIPGSGSSSNTITLECNGFISHSQTSAYAITVSNMFRVGALLNENMYTYLAKGTVNVLAR
jgi:hypothetical protein